ncbi:MAG: YfbK domain-containing protein, partial [Verrucomicrobiales bacterium]
RRRDFSASVNELEALREEPSSASGSEELDERPDDRFREVTDRVEEDREALASTIRTRALEYGTEPTKVARPIPIKPAIQDQQTRSRGPISRPELMREIDAKQAPFSTFSLHVGEASFLLAAAALERGEIPDPAMVRTEEFYNAFDYGDPVPRDDEPVACALEQSAHPAVPQRNMMRVAIRTGGSGRMPATPLNLTLLLDHSGSMERDDREEGVRKAITQLSSLLGPGDTITVVGFARTPHLLADRLDGADAGTLDRLVESIPSQGGTNLETALALGLDLARRQFVEGAQNRVVLFTDGAANLGDAEPERLNETILKMRELGIAFDAAGFGADGLNDELLERLTRQGNGRYYVVDRPEDSGTGFAAKLAGAFRPAAEDVKVQVVFNPSRVGRYKLFGFEKHRLKQEDFRNDLVDAAELAAEETGVALYQFEPLPEGEGDVGEVRVRFREVASGQMVERTWTIPYDPQVPAFADAKESLQLATVAAFTAERLRRSSLAGVVEWSELTPVMERVQDHFRRQPSLRQLRAMVEALR